MNETETGNKSYSQELKEDSFRVDKSDHIVSPSKTIESIASAITLKIEDDIKTLNQKKDDIDNDNTLDKKKKANMKKKLRKKLKKAHDDLKEASVNESTMNYDECDESMDTINLKSPDEEKILDIGDISFKPLKARNNEINEITELNIDANGPLTPKSYERSGSIQHEQIFEEPSNHDQLINKNFTADFNIQQQTKINSLEQIDHNDFE